MDSIIVLTPDQLETMLTNIIRGVFTEFKDGMIKNPELPEIINIRQAAELLNLAPQTLYGFTSAKKIPFLKRGKKLYFKRTDLIAWISTPKVTADHAGMNILEWIRKVKPSTRLFNVIQANYWAKEKRGEELPLVQDITLDDFKYFRNFGAKCWEEFLKLRGY